MTAEPQVSPPRRKRRASVVDTAQLGLFDAPQATAPPARVLRPQNTDAPSVAVGADAAKRIRGRRSKPVDAPRTLTVEDMPTYPTELHEAVDRMLSDLKSEHMLMTYRAIKDCFGISRATVARRVKDGLVPGVRIANGRVLEDGPVRRFDRTQVRWLLLAVRFRSASDRA